MKQSEIAGFAIVRLHEPEQSGSAPTLSFHPNLGHFQAVI